jgi:acyl-CoA dehydrogenase
MSVSELGEIRGLAREFAAAELRPHVERWDAQRALDEGVIAGIAELGFFGMLVPESAGGMGFDTLTYLAALEELAWGEAGVALLVAQSTLATDFIAGAGGAHAELLAEMAAGNRIGCIAFADGDAADAESAAGGARAEQRGEDWVLAGTKPWVTNGAAADVAVVLAGGGPDRALFLVEGAAWSAGTPWLTSGLRTVPVVPLLFEDAPAARLRTGTDVRSLADTAGRLPVSAIAVGISQAAFEHAVRYAAEREQFGRPIRSFEGIQFKLAEMATRIAAARALVERAATTGRADAASMAKLAAGSCAMFVTTEAVQIFGGYGYMRDYPVEKLMRDAKAMEIVHGTSEVQRLLIAASLYSD